MAAYELRAEGAESSLHPAEALLVAAARPLRRREFAAGRACARRALVDLGFPDAPLLRSTGGLPLWPDGATGSISHASGYCCAVALRPDAPGMSIGIDVERIGAVGADLYPMLFTPDERGWLSSMSPGEQAIASTKAFSAKEAFYKAQFALTQAWVDFVDVMVHPTRTGFSLSPALPQPALGPIEWPVEARAATIDDHALVAVVLQAKP